MAEEHAARALVHALSPTGRLAVTMKSAASWFVPLIPTVATPSGIFFAWTRLKLIARQINPRTNS